MQKTKLVSLDDDRKPSSMENHDKFEQMLSQIDDIDDKKEQFPRPNGAKTPIISYGVVLFHEEGDSISYYACQRRTTIEFSEIIRCGPRKNRLFHYLSNMTEHERDLLKNVQHSDIWDDLLFITKDMFPETKSRVSYIFNVYGDTLSKLIDLTESITAEPPFEFTKGRHNPLNDKSYLSTAIRELREEGLIDLGNAIELIEDITCVDIYRGTDGNLYETHYFVVKSPERFEPDHTYFDVDNKIEEFCISEDMHDYEWITLSKKQDPKLKSTPLTERLERLLFAVHKKLTDRSQCTV